MYDKKYYLCNRKQLTDLQEIHFIEIPKLKRFESPEEIVDLLEGWVEFLRDPESEVIRKLESKLSLQNAMENWTTKLPKIYLPEPRDLDNVIPQNDTFLSLEDIDLTKYKNQEHIGSMFKDYNLDQVNKIQVVKQADVVMLL